MIDHNFLIGGDPEFPCYNILENKYISLVNYIKGTKENPYPIDVQGCFQQLDNVAAEFNLPPCTEFWMLHTLIESCREHTEKWLKSAINSGITLQAISSARYDVEELASPEAMLFGCEPSYSIYREGVSERPSTEEVGNLRSFSYHLHFGWDEELEEDEMIDFILLCDIFLGIPSIMKDPDKDRRQLYGNLSDYRIKNKKRLEYRVLGAGMHNYPNTISNGIDLIRSNINNRKEIIKLYYKDLEMIDYFNFKPSLVKELIAKLKKNNHYNAR